MIEPITLVQIGERLCLGTFFSISGAHKLFDRDVRAKFTGMFQRIGVPRMAFPVALGELAGGLGIFTGTLTSIAATGLMMILGGAIYLDVWSADVVGKHPKDFSDWIAKALYCPEILMLFWLAAVILLGPGPYSVDGAVSFIFRDFIN